MRSRLPVLGFSVLGALLGCHGGAGAGPSAAVDAAAEASAGTGSDDAGGGGAGAAPAMVTVTTASRLQVMEGFGGALAFYVNFLVDHPSRSEIYDLIFRDLGLDILRVGNWYQQGTVDDATVSAVAAATASLGHAPRLLMSSWSPPASLKSNGDVSNGGTLLRQDGAFAYQGFARWWSDALQAYAERGVRPDFISIQNEPDFKATWASCLFGPTEGVDAANGGVAVAGYDRALDAVYTQVQGLAQVPQLLGPEISGLANNALESYLARMNGDHFGGVAHHLYSGGTPASPETFSTAMRLAAASAGAKPRFMTEFAPSPQNMFATAWLIHDAVTVEGVSAYIYWDLTWAAPGGLVTTENPYDTGQWTSPKGYVVRDPYYALKHFARWVDTGWTRVAATSSTTTVKVSAFISPDGRQTTLVLLNTGPVARDVTISVPDWTFTTSDIFRTSGAPGAGTAERTTEVGPLSSAGVVTLPALAIATVTLTE